jgi:hypothetical protein
MLSENGPPRMAGGDISADKASFAALHTFYYSASYIKVRKYTHIRSKIQISPGYQMAHRTRPYSCISNQTKSQVATD